MSVGPMGTMGSVAGSQLPQTKGADAERTQQETVDQVRQTESNRKAENASGVGETEQDQEASDRDADGRRLWEAAPESEAHPEGDETGDLPRSKDPRGKTGANLDLRG
ncbi:MAG: hypothetical protein ACC628_02550 [Pirellulaceae bacterium]